MFLAGARCLFGVFILYLSGVRGKPNRICALEGSSVNLPCSDRHPTSSMNWYTVYRGNFKIEPSANKHHAKYSISADSNFTLTINNLTENDANIYCCRETAVTIDICKKSGIYLHVVELQVKVIPATEGHTVTLMCSSSSCPLTENPSAYIWYKNKEFLYEDWSPWYQELLSSEEAVKYSCAVKGYEDLRAPEVSVDSITPTCFSVTYAKGEMCYYKQGSDKSCSITYPKEVHAVRTPGNAHGSVTLTCSTTCPLTQTGYMWHRNSQIISRTQKISAQSSSGENLFCAVLDHEHLRSAEVCADNGVNCWSVNYANRRICALEGSSVNIISEYSHPGDQQPKSKFWIKRKDKEDEKLTEAAGRVEYHDNKKNQHVLTIKNLTKNDSAEYIFRLQKDDKGWEQSDLSGVLLIVTDLRVKITPSAVVTEDQKVTLTCSTSCPLTHNTNYIWYLNSRPLNLTENQNKHLILAPGSRENAGNYSCAVKTNKDSITQQLVPAVAGAVAAVLVLTSLIIFCCMRKKKTSNQSPGSETSTNIKQESPVPLYENISAPYGRTVADNELYANMPSK